MLVLNNNVLRSKSTARTNGLYPTRDLIAAGMVSRGRMTSDKNKNNAPIEMDARDAVSCDLKRYPIIIPMLVKSTEIKKSMAKKLFRPS